MNIKNLYYLDSNKKTDIFNSLNQYLNITTLQYYFPTLLNISKSERLIEDDNYTLKSKFILDKINYDLKPEQYNEKQKSPYIKRIYNASILNTQTKKTENKNIFIKINPLIDVIHYLITKYKENTNIYLSDYNYNLISDSVNDFNNEAYIDAYFSYLASKMTESGKCPTFPIFYGTYSCIIDNFKHGS